MINGVGVLIFAVIFLLPSTACSKAAPITLTEQQRPATTSASPRDPQKDRTAIPEIDGCTRDQTTFYRGKVLLFRKTPKSIEITIRTEWDTTEKLVHSMKERPLEFRLRNQPISASEFQKIEARLKDPNAEVRATVWVCQFNDSQSLRIIDWETTATNSTP